MMLESLITTGRICDIAIAMLVAEVAVLALLFAARSTGIPTRMLLLNAGAGISFALALRAALTNSEWTWIATFLGLALVFHVLDLSARWQAGPART